MISSRTLAACLALFVALLRCAQAQDASPLIGAWSWQAPDQSGGIASNTVVYRPDSFFTLTTRAPSGLAMRFGGTWKADLLGPNRWRISVAVTDMLPKQICAGGPSGSACNQLPMPPPLPPAEVRLVDNTLRSGTITAARDPSPVLAMMQIPAVMMLPTNTGGGNQMCALGTSQCFGGYMRTCQHQPTGGTWWITSAVRCGR